LTRKKRNNADKLTRLEDVKIPEDFDYKIKSMSILKRDKKLGKIQIPVTISQASRISGVSPSDVSVLLLIYMGDNIFDFRLPIYDLVICNKPLICIRKSYVPRLNYGQKSLLLLRSLRLK
jgi:hypothetical protein